jgi:hypothetical protein
MSAPGKERKRHFVVEKLSLAGKKIVDDGLSANETYEKVCAALLKATGEKLPVSSLQRYHANRWFPVRRTLAETERLFAMVKDSLEGAKGKPIDEVTSEMLKTLLFNGMAAAQNQDPLALYDLVLAEGRLGVQKERNKILTERTANDSKKVKVLERNLELKEKQIEQSRQKAQQAAREVEKIGQALKIPADKMAQIKEQFYGIVEPAH